MVLLDWPAENRGNSCQRKHPAEMLALGSSCASHRRSSNANSLCGRNSAGSRKSVRSFKGIFCHDISEFESYMPSQTVRSLCALSGLPNYVPERSAPFRDSPFAKKRFVDHTVCDTTIG